MWKLSYILKGPCEDIHEFEYETEQALDQKLKELQETQKLLIHQIRRNGVKIETTFY